MKDQPGVVNKLIEAVAALDINIVKKESSGINYLAQHFVEMVLDWRTSPHGEFLPTTVEMLSRYDNLKYRIPIIDYRYVRLYEEIMCRCGDVVHIDSDYGVPLPAISIVPFRGGSTWMQHKEVTIEADESGKYNVKFQIPEGFLNQIRRFTQHADGEGLPYIISSETNSRSLRVFFPKKEIEKRILQVGFVHQDMPGALSAITSVLAKSGFNILTGLLRKKSRNESGYEVVLEYQHEDPPPQASTEGYSDVFRWVQEKIEACSSDEIAELERFEVSIETPLYPKSRIPVEPLRLSAQRTVFSSKPLLKITKEEQEELIEQRIQNVQKTSPRAETEEVRLNLLRDVKSNLSSPKPVLFLSYPTVAKAHAELLKAELSNEFPNYFEITDYQTSDFEIVVKSVKDRLRRCDYFVGIWHHEDLLGHDEATISPWMPFEYGIALQAEKKAIVIHSDKLPQPIWKRIDPGISQPAYNDLTFSIDMIPKVINYVRKHWWKPDN